MTLIKKSQLAIGLWTIFPITISNTPIATAIPKSKAAMVCADSNGAMNVLFDRLYSISPNLKEFDEYHEAHMEITI